MEIGFWRKCVGINTTPWNKNIISSREIAHVDLAFAGDPHICIHKCLVGIIIVVLCIIFCSFPIYPIFFHIRTRPPFLLNFFIYFHPPFFSFSIFLSPPWHSILFSPSLSGTLSSSSLPFPLFLCPPSLPVPPLWPSLFISVSSTLPSSHCPHLQFLPHWPSIPKTKANSTCRLHWAMAVENSTEKMQERKKSDVRFCIARAKKSNEFDWMNYRANGVVYLLNYLSQSGKGKFVYHSFTYSVFRAWYFTRFSYIKRIKHTLHFTSSLRCQFCQKMPIVTQVINFCTFKTWNFNKFGSFRSQWQAHTYNTLIMNLVAAYENQERSGKRATDLSENSHRAY